MQRENLAQIVALCFLAFVAGSLATHYKVPPTDLIVKETESLVYKIRSRLPGEQLPDSWEWREAHNRPSGVTIYDPSRAYNGYTLYSGAKGQRADLIDMQGRVVHSWNLPYSQIWDETSPIRHPVADDRIWYRKTHMYANGDLLILYEATGVTPWGYGIAKVDYNSKLIWKYLGETHHDVCVGPDGRVYTVEHQFVDAAPADLPNVPSPFLNDYLTVLSPEGKLLKKVSIFDAIRNSKYKIALEMSHLGEWDVLHTNDVDVLTEKMAPAFPFAKAGQVLISFRNLDAMAIIDLDDEVVVWFQKGEWVGQHDPQFLPNGHILLFDNKGDIADSGSRVLEYSPSDQKIVWEYRGTKEHPFYSDVRSTARRLPNGNTFITESSGGRIFEVTAEKDIVWEFYDPQRHSRYPAYYPVIDGGIRFAEGDLAFKINPSPIANGADKQGNTQ